MFKTVSKLGNFMTLLTSYNSNTQKYEVDISKYLKYKNSKIITLPQFNYVDFGENVSGYGFEEELDKYKCSYKLYQICSKYNISKNKIKPEQLEELKLIPPRSPRFANKNISNLSMGVFLVLKNDIYNNNKNVIGIKLRVSQYSYEDNYTLFLYFDSSVYYEVNLKKNIEKTIYLKDIDATKYNYMSLCCNPPFGFTTFYLSLIYEDGSEKSLGTSLRTWGFKEILPEYRNIFDSKFTYVFDFIRGNTFDDIDVSRDNVYWTSNYPIKIYNNVFHPQKEDIYGYPILYPIDINKDYTVIYLKSNHDTHFLEGKSVFSLDALYKKYGHNTNFISIGVPFKDILLYKNDIFNTLLNKYNVNNSLNEVFIEFILDNKEYYKRYNKKFIVINTDMFSLLFGDGYDTQDIETDFGNTFKKEVSYIDNANISVNVMEVI